MLNDEFMQGQLILLEKAFIKKMPLNADQKNLLVTFLSKCVTGDDELNKMVREINIESDASLIAVKLMHYSRSIHKDRVDESSMQRIAAIHTQINQGEIKNVVLNRNEFAFLREMAALMPYFIRMNHLDIMTLDPTLSEVYKKIQACHEVLRYLEKLSQLNLHIEPDQTDRFPFSQNKLTVLDDNEQFFRALKAKKIICDVEAPRLDKNPQP
jgi:hypothetical protein